VDVVLALHILRIAGDTYFVPLLLKKKKKKIEKGRKEHEESKKKKRSANSPIVVSTHLLQ
jgi:hypothetical protein